MTSASPTIERIRSIGELEKSASCKKFPHG
jgi:hypothetical protein